jgi:hypothetical protein
VVDQQIAQASHDRHGSPASAALRMAGGSVAVDAALDMDEPVGEADIVPIECSELTAAQPGVERATPERAVGGAKGGEERARLGR